MGSRAIGIIEPRPKRRRVPDRHSSSSLSLLDDHDRVGYATRLEVELEPGRNSEDAPGEAGGERIAKERVAGALASGHRSVSGRPKAGKSSGYLKKCMPATRPDSISTTLIANGLASAPSPR